jgi:hypothetical protein
LIDPFRSSIDKGGWGLNMSEFQTEFIYMNELLESELVTPVMPVNFIYQIPYFTKTFLTYVDSKYSLKKEIYEIKNGNLRYTKRIHFEKMDEIGHELAERGLAIQSSSFRSK